MSLKCWNVLALALSLMPFSGLAQAQEGAAGRVDWLEVVSRPEATLPPSAILANKDSIYRGDLIELDIVLSNPSDQDRLLHVDVSLGVAAYFAGGTRGVEIAEPEKAPVLRELVWRQLSLPAHSSGRLELTVILRPNQDAGDLVIGLEALDLMGAESILLNFHRRLSFHPSEDYPSMPLWVMVVILGLIASLLIYVVARKMLAPESRIRQLSGRVAAFFAAALLGGIIGLGMIQGVFKSYMGTTETTCTVLDRRSDLETQSGTGTGSNRSSGTYMRPLIAAEYESRHGRQIAVGFGSDMVSPGIEEIEAFQIGDEVICWYENESPEQFFVIRGFDTGAVVLFLFFSGSALIFLYIAFRPAR